MQLSAKKAIILLASGILLIIYVAYKAAQKFGPIALVSDPFLATFFYLGILISSLLIILKVTLIYQKRIKKQAKEEGLGNYSQGAIKEKVIHRELHEWEKELLEKKYKETKNRNFDLDRRAPVFKIQGKLIRRHLAGNAMITIPEEWSIRGFKLNEGNFPDIKVKYFREEEEIAVEFSPFSKWVWDTYKIIKGKKVWQMSLNEEIFNLVKEHKVSVVARLACGTHDFDEIKTGDIIQFSNFNVSTLGFGPTVNIKVNYIKHYPTVQQLFDTEGLTNIYPQVKNIEEGIQLIKSLDIYGDRIKRGGIYAIGIRY